MFKKTLIQAIVILSLALVSASAFACGGANSGKHIGNITAVNKSGKTFTIRDMESSSAITFKANDEIMAGINGAGGQIMVNYEEDDEGSLVAVGVTF